MSDDKPFFELGPDDEQEDPDELPVRDRKIVTQNFDIVTETLVDQIKGGTIFLRPISQRPMFQRKFVWSDRLSSRLIESMILNIPIPPCYLSQNEEYELDVIDGQQRLYSIFRFIENQFRLSDIEVLKELDGLRFFELPSKIQRQIKTHTMRCVVVLNESHSEIKFDIFERLNTSTVPLNAQELRNCIYRGSLNDLLGELSEGAEWLSIIGRKHPDPRLRNEEAILRFFAFHEQGIESYRTPQKHWLNSAAKQGRRYSEAKIAELRAIWAAMIDNSLTWFAPRDCFRRPGSRAINKALFDLVGLSATKISAAYALQVRGEFRRRYKDILEDEEFLDLISRAVDHTRRTRRRFEIWNQRFGDLLN
jgi:hypothetical protein